MSTKKYGIISLNIYEKDNNWGSILQSYALQEILSRQGYGTEIINICPDFIKAHEAKYPITRALPFNLKLFKNTFRNSVLNFKTFVVRDKKFKHFIKNNYTVSKKYTTQNLPVEQYRGFIVGSDIVWNIDFTMGFNDLYFCNLPRMNNLNNISYAPSMCDRLFTKDEEVKFAEMLKNFKHISVRESSQVKYVKKFTDNDVEAVIDPTLLLDESDYAKFLKNRLFEENYILVYTVPTDKALVDYAVKYAKEHNKKVVLIECLNIQKKSKDYISYNDAGIEEWLTLVKYADHIFTNSFHACIFSIIFKKQFHAVYRNPGKTKIADLCDSLKINNFSEKKQSYSFNMKNEIDYKSTYTILDKLRKTSLEYLNKSLDN